MSLIVDKAEAEHLAQDDKSLDDIVNALTAAEIADDAMLGAPPSPLPPPPSSSSSGGSLVTEPFLPESLPELMHRFQLRDMSYDHLWRFSDLADTQQRVKLVISPLSVDGRKSTRADCKGRNHGSKCFCWVTSRADTDPQLVFRDLLQWGAAGRGLSQADHMALGKSVKRSHGMAV